MGAQITGGVDTHLDVHVVAALDGLGGWWAGVVPDHAGGLSGSAGWLGSFGEVVVVGVEGTGSYGAGLARHLQREGWRWWRSTVRTGSVAAGRASPTRMTR